MANDFARNPWVIDTPFAVAPSPIIELSSVPIDHFEFLGYQVDTDSVVVNDNTGGLLWADNGAADLRNVRSGTIGPSRGVLVPTLTAGKLLVYFKH